MSETPTQAYEATESFAFQDSAGNNIVIQQGATRVSEDSEVRRRFPQYFQPLELQFSPVEEATAEPGRARDRGRSTQPKER